MISTNKALEFVSNVLEIDDFQNLYSHNKLLALEKVVRGFIEKIPFNNIESVSKPFCEREFPTVAQNIESVLEREGGLCWTLSTAAYHILSALGYDVILGAASVSKERGIDHAMLFVKGCATPESVHLVDIASFPTFEPVPMDFESESEVYKTNTMWYKYVRESEGKYIRFKHIDDSRLFDFAGKDFWTPSYYFKFPYSIDSDTLGRHIKAHTHDNPNDIFNLGPRLTRYVNEKLVAVKHDVILFENEEGRIVKKFITDDDDCLANEIFNLFPEINRGKVLKAISLWRQCGSHSPIRPI